MPFPAARFNFGGVAKPCRTPPLRRKPCAQTQIFMKAPRGTGERCAPAAASLPRRSHRISRGQPSRGNDRLPQTLWGGGRSHPVFPPGGANAVPEAVAGHGGSLSLQPAVEGPSHPGATSGSFPYPGARVPRNSKWPLPSPARASDGPGHTSRCGGRGAFAWRCHAARSADLHRLARRSPVAPAGSGRGHQTGRTRERPTPEA
jgi:hypothetical protein